MYVFTITHNFKQKYKIYEISEIKSNGRWEVIFKTDNIIQAKIYIDTIGFQIKDYVRHYDKKLNYNQANFFNFNFSEYYFRN